MLQGGRESTHLISHKTHSLNSGLAHPTLGEENPEAAQTHRAEGARVSQTVQFNNPAKSNRPEVGTRDESHP